MKKVELENVTTKSIVQASTVTLGIKEYQDSGQSCQEVVFAWVGGNSLLPEVLDEVLDKYSDEIGELIWYSVTN